MAFLLYGVGALALMAGAVMIGIGIPVNEFSFGNTMILAGTTTMVGGLIIVALGIAVGAVAAHRRDAGASRAGAARPRRPGNRGVRAAGAAARRGRAAAGAVPAQAEI